MQDIDKTISFKRTTKQLTSLLVTIFDGNAIPRTIKLDELGKKIIYFGRDPQNDIVLNSKLVTSNHGRFVFDGNLWVMEDKAAYEKNGSTNGLIYNNVNIVTRTICDGDFIRIDDGVETISAGVLFVFTSSDSDNRWNTISISKRNELTIGREKSNDVVLSHVSVSKYHAKIVYENNEWYIVDNDSTNGVILNNERIYGKVKLHEKDVITITNSKIIFTSSMLSYCCYKKGISVDALDIVIERRDKKRKKKITCNHANVGIKPGEFVAIIGGSGAGKSTLLNSMCGYLKPTYGEVYINGIDLYNNFNSLKKLIGYVPQSDIVYDNLTLNDMLLYAAELRLPKDVSKLERESAITRAIELVELSEERNSFIKSLSGGQRKRASIAVELLSDPNLLFLDEPASGLDPGTERNLMQSLRSMANSGKTVIIVTHSTLQLKLCDKIVFMGKGGNLCFCGSYYEAMEFFGVSDIIDVYNMITEEANFWSLKYEKLRITSAKVRKTSIITDKNKEGSFKQFCVLSKRYLKLVINDRQRLLLLLLQAPLLSILISFVADGKQFEQYEMTKSLLFALSCSAFWVGMLNAIQEICKERTIMKREYMTGLSLNAYVASKMAVLGFLCLIQSFMIIGVFSITVGLPQEGISNHPVFELMVTTYMTALASTAMGLYVSALFNNADRAMTIAPILLMPQILFSGLIFKLNGTTEIISWLAICRWSMEGYGTTANLNNLPLRLQQEGIMIPHEIESFFEFTKSHLFVSWIILALYTIIFLVLARIVLAKIGKEKS